jgi:hypothetical protein
MAMIACKECATEISSTAKACPKCGAPLPRTKWGLWITLGVLGFLMLTFLVPPSPQAEEKYKARSIIERCWDQQKRPSLSAGERQFMATACETMEADFQRKYGVRP